MITRHCDGSAGDADYGSIGAGYATYRQPDPAIARCILDALGDAKSIVNVGAGAGSYEPVDRIVTAVEPSASMRAQRPPHLSAAIDAVAEHSPFADDTFDAALATFTVHQWSSLADGLAEMRRVSRGAVVILTCDPGALASSWLPLYAPEMIAVDRNCSFREAGSLAEIMRRMRARNRSFRSFGGSRKFGVPTWNLAGTPSRSAVDLAR